MATSATAEKVARPSGAEEPEGILRHSTGEGLEVGAVKQYGADRQEVSVVPVVVHVESQRTCIVVVSERRNATVWLREVHRILSIARSIALHTRSRQILVVAPRHERSQQ